MENLCQLNSNRYNEEVRYDSSVKLANMTIQISGVIHRYRGLGFDSTLQHCNVKMGSGAQLAVKLG